MKQHDYVISSHSDEGLHHHNTSEMFNSVHTIVYYTLVVCYQSKGEKGNKKRKEFSGAF